jgi:hypothetical protein
MKKTGSNRQVRTVGTARSLGRRRQAGIGLVETVVSAGLGILATVFALIVVPRYLEKQKVGEEISALSRLIPDMQMAANGETSWASFDSTRISNENILPAEYKTATAGSFRNRFDGVVTFAPDTRSSANDTMNMTSTQWPQSACLTALRAIDGITTRVQVNGSTVKAFGGTLNQTTLTTQCANAPVTTIISFSK